MEAWLGSIMSWGGGIQVGVDPIYGCCPQARKGDVGVCPPPPPAIWSLLRVVLRQFHVLVAVVSQTNYGLISISCLGENVPLYVRDNHSIV